MKCWQLLGKKKVSAIMVALGKYSIIQNLYFERGTRQAALIQILSLSPLRGTRTRVHSASRGCDVTGMSSALGSLHGEPAI